MRLETLEKSLAKLQLLATELQSSKADQKVFAETAERTADALQRQDTKVDSLETHCVALDQYLDKFQPLRMQAMINDHLSACLHAETRRKHKIYEDKKTGLLLRLVLEDGGDKLRIQELIREVTKMA